MFINPASFPTGRQTYHHDHLTQLPAGFLCCLLVDSKVNLKLDISGHNVGEESLGVQICLGYLESVSLVFSIFSESNIDLILCEVNESPNHVSLFKFLSIFF